MIGKVTIHGGGAEYTPRWPPQTPEQEAAIRALRFSDNTIAIYQLWAKGMNPPRIAKELGMAANSVCRNMRTTRDGLLLSDVQMCLLLAWRGDIQIEGFDIKPHEPPMEDRLAEMLTKLAEEALESGPKGRLSTILLEADALLTERKRRQKAKARR